jgi:ferredoxin
MRVCPTNIIHPAAFEGGIEGFWTPVLNFRIGTSGCQVNCVACGQICPTAAIRPISLDEKHGKGEFEESGPICLGTAFVDRGRCLPWAMGRPCIVCEENCPVSPKAIIVREVHEPVTDQRQWSVEAVEHRRISLAGPPMEPGAFGTGDYLFRVVGKPEKMWPILDNGRAAITVTGGEEGELPGPGTKIEVLIRLKQPHIVPERCIGCGICEHECPVLGKRAVRVTAENETRNRDHTLLARTNNR